MNQPCLIMLFKFFFTASNLSVAVSFFSSPVSLGNLAVWSFICICN